MRAEREREILERERESESVCFVERERKSEEWVKMGVVGCSVVSCIFGVVVFFLYILFSFFVFPFWHFQQILLWKYFMLIIIN